MPSTHALRKRWKLFTINASPITAQPCTQGEQLLSQLNRLDRAYAQMTDFEPVLSDGDQRYFDRLRSNAMRELDGAMHSADKYLEMLCNGQLAGHRVLSRKERKMLTECFSVDILDALEDYRRQILGQYE